MSTKDLIAEMTENVNKYGKENMTTYLMVQAIKELGRLAEVDTSHAEWISKTEWARKDAKPSELGKHLADVIQGRFAAVEVERDALRARLDGAVKAAQEVFGEKAIRYKFSLDEDGRPYTTLPPEMDGRWYALQPAEDDAHIGLCDEIVRLRAQVEALRKDLADANNSAAWHKRRTSLLQTIQATMQEPERTIVCDVLANGHLLQGPDGKPDKQRYAAPSLTRPAVPDQHPMQPVVVAPDGIHRFKRNAIVRRLLDHGQSTGFGLNELACEDFTGEDRMQLAQLIGYSVGGYSVLSYVTDESYEAAAAASQALESTAPQPEEPDPTPCPKCDGTGLTEFYPSQDPACKPKQECCSKCEGRGYLKGGE